MRFMPSPAEPMWNWESDDWGVFAHDSAALLPALAAARRAQGEVLGHARAIGLTETHRAQALIWTAESLATAAIEGEALNLDGVRSSIAKRLGLPGGKTARQRPVEGLLDMMQDATAEWRRPLTAERLCGWQNALFPSGFSGLNRITTGAFRTGAEPMQIVSGPVTRRKVHFEAPPARRVAKEMGKFIKWFNRGASALGARGGASAKSGPSPKGGPSVKRGPDARLDGILRAGLAHLWFESIHPFDDGNGRVGRAIADLALAQDAQSGVRLISLAAELSAERDTYYNELHTASRADADITRWLIWFCETFTAACARSVKVIDSSLAKARFWAVHAHAPLNAAQRKVVNRLLDAGPRGFAGDLTTSKYLGIAGVSRATAFRNLAALAEHGLLGTAGQGKATRYFINLPGWAA